MSDTTHQGASAPFLRFSRRFIDRQRRFLSDVEIKCQGTRFRAHSKIIALHSPALRRMCKPSHDRLGHLDICLDDEPVLAVKVMVDYLYSLQLRLPSDSSHLIAARAPNGAVVDTPAFAQVSMLGSRFGITHLEQLANAEFRMWVAYLPFAALTCHFAIGTELWENNPMADALDRVLEAVYARGASHRSDALRSIIVDSMLTDKIGRLIIPPDSPAADPVIATAAREDFECLLRAMPDLRSDLVAAISSRAGRAAAAITPDHICAAYFWGGLSSGEAVPCSEEDPAEICWADELSEDMPPSVDPEVLRAIAHPDYSVSEHAYGLGDPPAELYLMQNALDHKDGIEHRPELEVARMIAHPECRRST